MGVWVDTDMGVDDLLAVLLVLRHAQVDGMSLSFGNAPLDQVCRNAAGARQHYGWRMPVFRGADRAILGQTETAQAILGTSGMPSRGARLPVVEADFAPALPAMAGWLERKGDRDAQILALGPLTNLAILALARPDLIARLGRIIWMGGGVTRGNHTASAEFNALADPEALAILLARRVPITMVDLDACRKVEITPSDHETLRAEPVTQDLLGGYLDIGLSRGRAGMALYDPVAAAVMCQPQHFGLSDAHIDVELAGQHTRGRTVVDLRRPAAANAQIVTDVDSAAVKDMCFAAWGVQG
jgi:inosine-uridine nucleoside N-ribohydrolase